MVRRDVAIALAIGGVVLLTRLPFATHVLWEWDSVLYSRALEQGFHVGIDLEDQRPHPPGYLFYVGAAALLRPVLGDSNAALVAVSMLASAAAAAALYLLARRFARPGIAAFAALAFAADPLVWTLAEEAMPYAVLALASIVVAATLHEARAGSVGRVVAASVALGLLAGFRQDLLLLFGPLWLWTALRRGPRALLLGALALAGACLVWFLPAAALSGGIGTYVGAIAAQSASIARGSAVSPLGTDVLSYNLRFTLYALAWALLGAGVLLLVLLLAPFVRWLGRPRGPRVDDRAAFFLLWLVPGFAVYALLIIGEWGYVQSIVPGLYVLLAALLDRAVPRSRAALAISRALAVGLVGATAIVFLALPLRFSATALAAHDQSVRQRVTYVRDHFPADRTILLAREDFLLARYYLPAYRAWLYDPRPESGATARKGVDDADTLVIFTPDLTLRQRVDERAADLGDGERLRSVPLRGGTVELYGEGAIARER